VTEKEEDYKEGGITLIIKSIPSAQLLAVEEALEKLMDDFDLTGTFWSQTSIVSRKRKHRRASKGKGQKASVEGYVSETR